MTTVNSGGSVIIYLKSSTRPTLIFFLMALSCGAWWSMVYPLLMSDLLLSVSGVTLLEKDISQRRPAYHDYIERTNAFFPGPLSR